MNSIKIRKIKIISYSLFIILLDQVSKFLILITLGFERSKNIIANLLNFTIVKNKGAAFSLFSDSTIFLTFTSIFVSLLLITIIAIFLFFNYVSSLGALLIGIVWAIFIPQKFIFHGVLPRYSINHIYVSRARVTVRTPYFCLNFTPPPTRPMSF